ncbi:MAG: AAA family ATPase [Uliginosibacterium sp.]|nr:AAA family ATPase [Uliginosibacterium sp.]
MDTASTSRIQRVRALVDELRREVTQATNEAAVTPGKVRVYRHNLTSLIKGDCDGEGKISRRKQIAEKLQKLGPERSLGAWPEDALMTGLIALKSSHPNFAAVTDYLLDEASLAQVSQRPICSLRVLLSGDPGVGKTDYARSLGAVLGMPPRICSLSSAQSGAEFGGSDEYWSNSRCGAVFDEIVEGAYANPLFVLDEIDKVSMHHSDVTGALYQLLETHSARIFRDRSVPWLEIDASHVNWIATANELQRIHPALTSRFQNFEIPAPNPLQQRAIVQRIYQILQDELNVVGVLDGQLDDAQLDQITACSPRVTRKLLRGAIAKAVRLNQSRIQLTDTHGAKRSERRPVGFYRSEGDLA